MPSSYVESGAIIGGWPAVVIDKLMSRYLPKYLAMMTPEQLAELDRAHRAVARAAKANQLRVPSSDIGPSEPETIGPCSRLDSDDEIGTAKAAEVLGEAAAGVQLAAVWEGEGLARQVGRTWVTHRVAVEAHQDQQGRRTA